MTTIAVSKSSARPILEFGRGWMSAPETVARAGVGLDNAGRFAFWANGRGGVPWAERFGWSAPHPSSDPAARRQAEEMTSKATARSFESLTPDERAEFDTLVHEARACIAD